MGTVKRVRYTGSRAKRKSVNGEYPNRGNVLSTVPYVGICQLSISDKGVVLFPTTIYKFCETIYRNYKALTPAKCPIGTAETSNFVKSFFLIPTSLIFIRRHSILKMRGANRQQIRSEEVVSFQRRLGDFCNRVRFGASKNLVVEVLLGTHFMDQYTRGMC